MLFRSARFKPWLYRLPTPPRFSLPFSWNRTTEKYVILTASAPYDAYAMPDDANSVAGNYIIHDKFASPSGVEVTSDGAGILTFASPVTGRQLIHFREWRTAAQAYVVVTGAGDGITNDLYLNNVAPVETAPISDQTAWTNIAILPIVVSAGVSDAEGDALTFTGLSVPGLIIETIVVGLSTVQAITGTPTTPGDYAVSLTATDIVGDSVVLTTFHIVVGTSQLIPDVTGDTLATALVDLAAVLTLSEITITSEATGTPGLVNRTEPVAGTYVTPGTAVVVFYRPYQAFLYASSNVILGA